MTRRAVTRQDALKWYTNWSYTDHEIAERHVDRLGVQAFYTTATAGYIGAPTPTGKF